MTVEPLPHSETRGRRFSFAWFGGLLALVSVTAVAPACTDDKRDGGAFSADADGDEGIGIDEGGDAMDDGDGVDDSGQPRLDSNNDGGSAEGNDDGVNQEGCEAVDFLFVIDNSCSMADEQDNLANSFPGFIQAIQNTVAEAQDYHIMVAKTDSGWGSTDCEILCPAFGFCPADPAYDCANPPAPPAFCDGEMGAGVVHPAGVDSSNRNCNLAGGHRYITPAQPDLAATFSCIATVGTGGSGSERPAEALTSAVSAALNGAGGCNDGFLRDDAILVVTVITDEEDASSPGIPGGWYQNVIARKGGDPTGIVMIGLINDTDASPSLCGTGADDPARLREFIDSFPNSYRGSVCAGDYAPVLADAVSIISTACDEYIPPAG